MSRRDFLRGSAALASAAAILPRASRAQDGKKVFRWAFNAAETGFDPAQVSDLNSNYVLSNIFEAPLQYDYLARPAVLRPRTASAMPEVSSDFRQVTVRIRPGTFFQGDPAFKGQRQLPDGPEREALIRDMKRIFNAYMPYKIHGHRFVNDVSHPWLIGCRRHPFARDFFKYVDVDAGARQG